MPHFGLLNVNKPTGVTSRSIVDRVLRHVRPDKVGHAGTLDPLASGVLIVCLGPATRLVEYVQAMKKQYRGTFLLGRSSPTEDIDGDVTELIDPPVPTLADIEHAAAQLTGDIQQRPPAFSAVKVEGKRSYDLAREGNVIEHPPRPVRIHKIDVIEYTYPQLTLDIECGGGTYVRTLGRDLAELLGSCAVMSALVRTAIGDFGIADAMDAERISKESIAASLISPLAALSALPQLVVTDLERKRIASGLPIEIRNNANTPTGECAAVDSSGRLAAILTPDPRGLRPTRCFV